MLRADQETDDILLKLGAKSVNTVWRNHFFATVHHQTGHVNYKTLALIFCVEDALPRTHKLITYTTGVSLDVGYLNVVCYLKPKFGGANLLTFNKWSALRSTGITDRYNTGQIENFTLAMEGYCNMLTNTDNVDHFNSHNIFKEIIRNIPRELESNFWVWQISKSRNLGQRRSF